MDRINLDFHRVQKEDYEPLRKIKESPIKIEVQRQHESITTSLKKEATGIAEKINSGEKVKCTNI